MSNRAGDRLLRLDPKTRIIPGGADSLHVVDRRGAFDLRGAGLLRLQERLAPVLDGRYTRAELLAAAGARAAAVDRYLDGLRESGALVDGPPPVPRGFPESRPGVQESSIAGTRVAVTLAGAESADRRAFRLSFATRAEVERHLLDRADDLVEAGRIRVACERDPDCHELGRRAAVARHLLAVELGRGNRRRLSIFELAPVRLALRRTGLVDPPSIRPDSLAQQLEWVRLMERTQLPLTVMVGELPGLGRRRIAYGLDASEARAELITAFLGSEALIAGAAARKVTGTRGRLCERAVRGRTVVVEPDQVRRAVVASSPLACAQKLVCEWAAGAAGSRGSTVDLLSTRTSSPRIAFLQEVLRRRRGSVPVTINQAAPPLVSVRSSSYAVVRLDVEEAVTEALLRTLAEDVGIDAAAGLPCAGSLRHPATARRRLAAALSHVPKRVPIVVGRFRAFGATSFFGFLSDDLEHE